MRLAHISPRRGFTLIETAMALVIVGVGVTAAMQLFASCTAENQLAMKMSNALLLANNIREATNHLPFADRYQFGPSASQRTAGPKSFSNVTCFNGASLKPPIDGNCITHPELSQYTQNVKVEVMQSPYNFFTTTAVPATPPAGGYQFGVLRITVSILYTANSKTSEVYRTSWFRSNE